MTGAVGKGPVLFTSWRCVGDEPREVAEWGRGVAGAGVESVGRATTSVAPPRDEAEDEAQLCVREGKGPVESADWQS